MAFREKLISIAKEEWEFFGMQEILRYEKDKHGKSIPVFGKTGHRETEDNYYQRVGTYWKTGVNTNLDGKDVDQPWSAAFISYIMKTAGAESRFLYNAQHSAYIRKAIIAKQKEDTAYGFWGYRLSDYVPEIGDLICYLREDSVGTINYDSTTNSYPSHSDLVVDKKGNTLKVIGGNVENSVSLKNVKIDDNGFLTDTSKAWFVILKNRIAAPNTPAVAPTTTTTTKTYLVTGDGVRIRKSPEKTTDNKIGDLFKGDVVSYIETSGDKEWAKVKHGETTGWVSLQYLVPVDAPQSNSVYDDIANIVKGLDVVRYYWKEGQGIAPIGYYQGMALTYGRVYCKLKKGDPIVKEMAKKPGTDPKKDSLTLYNSIFKDNGMDNDQNEADTLRHLFVLMMGMGMLESSGRHCVGAERNDKKDIINPKAEEAEAGLFQTSYNAISSIGDPMLKTIYQSYKANPENGFLTYFSKGANCKAQEGYNSGTGEGVVFQELSKKCPAFSVEFTALSLRKTSRHWSTVRDQRAEIIKGCDDMFLKVQQYIDTNNIETL
ncbi:DUF2272 domain-containing protein [Flavobacterium sp.]|uniref:DUF2272 domain-containing protein n=1 Tax=Flavobacterium sp. TaxID=239 RepID=UPI0025B84B46|nr:DUF2272 domain-containing protein [Flavobacterium sp.]